MQNPLTPLIEGPSDKAKHLEALYRLLVSYSREVLKESGAERNAILIIDLNERIYNAIKNTHANH